MVARFQQIYCVQPDLSRLYCGPFGGILGAAHRHKTRDLFFARMRALVLAMTVRIILILAVASMIGPSLAFSSPACLTESEALAKFPKATHLYMRQNCWSDSAIAPVHSTLTCGSARAFATTRNSLQCLCLPHDPKSRQCLLPDPKSIAAVSMSPECKPISTM